jgi:hypothetical protein
MGHVSGRTVTIEDPHPIFTQMLSEATMAETKHDPPPHMQNSSTPWKRRKSHHPETLSRRIEIVDRISISNSAGRRREDKSAIVDQEASDQTEQ